MTADEYVPDEQDLEVAWIESEASADDINVASAEFARFLARVRRDAAREALGGLADEANHVDWQMDGPSFALRVRRFKNRNHPEETP